ARPGAGQREPDGDADRGALALADRRGHQRPVQLEAAGPGRGEGQSRRDGGRREGDHAERGGGRAPPGRTQGEEGERQQGDRVRGTRFEVLGTSVVGDRGGRSTVVWLGTHTTAKWLARRWRARSPDSSSSATSSRGLTVIARTPRPAGSSARTRP